MVKIKPIHLKTFTYVLVIVSVIFLARYLIKNKLLQLPGPINWYWILASLALLISGFLTNGISWRIILRSNQIMVSWKDSISSLGISIFGKYIPGKIWLITGISSKVASITGSSVITISMLATVIQVLTILISLVIGAISLKPYIDMRFILLFYIFSVFVTGLFLVFQKKICASRFVQRHKVTRKWLSMVVSSVSPQLIFWIIVTWILWSISFYFLAMSLGISMDFTGAFILPLGLSVGIIVLIAPGGLGVREGALSLLLSSYVASRHENLALATFSRVWYLAGEVFIFLFAMLLTLIKRRKMMGNEQIVRPA